MADVKLNIAGRVYDVHCADGQEPQLMQLATLVDEKVRSMPGGTEIRQMLFAALMLADEAQEAKGKVDKAEPRSDSLRAAVGRVRAHLDERAMRPQGQALSPAGGALKFQELRR